MDHAMYHAVEDQLRVFKETEVPLVCAFNKEHTRGEYVASHYIRFFDELCLAFLKMFSSLQLPDAFDPVHGGFLAKYHTFEDAWTTFHKKRANLRILCKACHLLHTATQYKVKKSAVPTTPVYRSSINQALIKTKEQAVAHPWLDLKTWGLPSDKGNYSRKLGEKQFTLFVRDNKWNYAYDNKFGSEKHDSIKMVLEETYQKFGDTIRRYL